MEKIILASQSPRRRELMEMLGLPFEVMVSEAEEKITGTDPAVVTEELSARKAAAVAAEIQEGIVIGADTVVALQGRILGKPADRAGAEAMIRSLQGQSHMVYTGVTLIRKRDGHTKARTFSEGTRVHVAAMSDSEIQAYLDTDEPYDKAGAYGIQGIFGKHIAGIEGDFYNVVGLPVHRLYQELKKLGDKQPSFAKK